MLDLWLPLRSAKRAKTRREPLPPSVRREDLSGRNSSYSRREMPSATLACERRELRAAPRHRLIGRVVGCGLRVLGRTLKLEVRGAQHIARAELQAKIGRGGALFAVWHGRLIVPALATRDRDYLVLVSRSGDGEIAAAAMRALGWRVARGSAFRGATGGTRRILRELNQGAIVALTPDGPRGPNRVALPGAVHLAAKAGCALHPVGAACRGWKLSTWDRLLIPRPFARAAMVVGEALTSGDSDAQQQTQQLQNAMLKCEAEAETLLQTGETRARDERIFLVWNALLLPLYPLIGAYTLWRRHVQGRSQASLRGQWGYVPRHVVRALHPKNADSAPIIWLHAVSVGETLAARPVARALRQAMPGCRIGLSVTTDSGFETAQGALKAREVEAVFYFPLDLPFVLRRVLKRIRPDLFLTMETELWPNLLHLARRQGAKTYLVNGRVSDNLLQTAPRLGPLWHWMMRNLDGCLMRSSFDAARLTQIGAASERVRAIGDVKLDSLPQDVSQAREKWRQELGIAPDALFWVAGSTHPGEEDIIVRAFTQLQTEFPGLRLLIAPRHIERAAEVTALVEQNGQGVIRRTQLSGRDNGVLLLDTVGELAQIYGAADVAFVGGSLIPRGGHNVLEPVLVSVPTIFGPHVANFREAARLAVEAHLGQQVQNEAELIQAVRLYLRDLSEREAIAPRAREALKPHEGAARRIARIVAEGLG